VRPPPYVRLEREEGIAVAVLVGEIDMARAGHVRDTLSNALGNDEFGLVVDLGEATYLDSAGVNVLFELAEWLRGRQQQLVSVAPDDSLIRQVLAIVNIAAVIPLYEDRTGAVGHLRAAAESSGRAEGSGAE